MNVNNGHLFHYTTKSTSKPNLLLGGRLTFNRVGWTIVVVERIDTTTVGIYTLADHAETGTNKQLLRRRQQRAEVARLVLILLLLDAKGPRRRRQWLQVRVRLMLICCYWSSSTWHAVFLNKHTTSPIPTVVTPPPSQIRLIDNGGFALKYDLILSNPPNLDAPPESRRRYQPRSSRPHSIPNTRLASGINWRHCVGMSCSPYSRLNWMLSFGPHSEGLSSTWATRFKYGNDF